MKQHTHHPQVSYMKELGLQFLIIFYEGEPNNYANIKIISVFD